MGCAPDDCMYLHSPPFVNGVQLCKWCAAKRKGPQHNPKSCPKQLQKDFPPRETVVRKVKTEQPAEAEDWKADPWVDSAVFEVRLRMSRGEGEEGCYHEYVRLYGEETEQPGRSVTGRKNLGKGEDIGRRWIRIPALGAEGPSPGTGISEVIVSVAEAMWFGYDED